VLLLVCVAAFLFTEWYMPVALAVGLAALHMPRGVGPRRLLAVLARLPVFVALIIFANMVLISRPGPWWRAAGAGLEQAVRVVVIVVAVNLYTVVTDPLDLSDAVLKVIGPLRRIGVRVGELSLMVMIVSSFIPFMSDEAKRLQTAQAARCGFPRRGVRSLKAAALLLTPLVVSVFRRADEIEASLQARSYRIGAPRSSVPRQGAERLDYLLCAASLLLFVAGVYAQF
jgi:energy-coupling factor transport system permease protein